MRSKSDRGDEVAVAVSDVVHAARIPFGDNLAAHRGGAMAHKLLFEGEENTPDNYAWVLADESSTYLSPRHRHAWDQVRFCLEGAVPLGKALTLEAGEVGYFPEGVAYGPQAGGPDRLVLVLQFGGASGQGYLSAAQLRTAHAALGQEGVFENGVFRRTRGEGQANLDAYEALWRWTTGRPIAYPRPRYKGPLVVRPENFSWWDEPGATGVRRRSLAFIPERGLALDMLALEPEAAVAFAQSHARRLAFVRRGEGRCDHHPYETHTAVRIEPGVGACFTASAASELFVIEIAPVHRPSGAVRQ